MDERGTEEYKRFYRTGRAFVDKRAKRSVPLDNFSDNIELLTLYNIRHLRVS